MPETHGQKDGRAERVQQTCEWLGAVPLSPAGDPVEQDSDPYSAAIHTHTQTVVAALESGINNIIISEPHEPTRDALKYALRSSLTPEEFDCLTFECDDIAPAGEITKVVQPTT